MLPTLAMEGLQCMLTQLYLPIVKKESEAWKPGVGVDVRAGGGLNPFYHRLLARDSRASLHGNATCR